MTNLNIMLNDFFNQHPGIKEAFARGLVNRRALAKLIIQLEKPGQSLDAVITALRRYQVQKEEEDSLKLVKKISITTKENISIVCLEKSQSVLAKLGKLITHINYNKQETLKLVEGNQSLKLFVDSEKLPKVKEIFPGKDRIKVINRIAELNLIFPEAAIKTRGIVAYITAALKTSKVNIIEILSCTPELIIYLTKRDLIPAYQAVKRLQTN